MSARCAPTVALLALGAAGLGPAARAQEPAAPPDFRRDVAPILERRCVPCHGPRVQRKSLRLDRRQSALAGGRSGPPIRAGDADGSLLMWHITQSRGKRRMPPREAPLTDAQIDVLRRWIDAGAPWPAEPDTAAPLAHWAYRPIAAVTPPAVAQPDWLRNAIDAFALARLEARGWQPAPSADRQTLLRRVSLDLTGLPPSEALRRAFAADHAPGAYERAVDALLASPRYGEHMARGWLDLARYADTKGFEKDARREIWLYRDWVIDAFNRDLSFDRFTIEQLAGDLLPDATEAQHIATAFHRNTMTNDEGGTDDEEFRVEAVHDRLSTTAQVWLGTTMECARCHDHKYDPIEQRDYYRAFAFFNNTEDSDKDDDRPLLRVLDASQRAERARLEALLARQRAVLDDLPAAVTVARDAWLAERELHRARFADTDLESGAWQLAGPLPIPPAGAADAEPSPADDAAWQPHPEWGDGVVHALPDGAPASWLLRRKLVAAAALDVVFSIGSDDGVELWLNGERLLHRDVRRGAAPDQDRAAGRLRAGDNEVVLRITNHGGAAGFAFALRPDDLGGEAEAALAVAAAERSAAQQRALTDAYLAQDEATRPLIAAADALQASIDKIRGNSVPVMRELPPDARRTTHVHRRGSFLAKGEAVEPGLPSIWPNLPADARRDRLGFAQWLVGNENPLTARVVVNRLWEGLFGRGLVATSEDFGTQGDPPSHPQLLDWLSRRLIDNGWSVKRMLRLMVTSATYRQTAAVPSARRAADPDNTWLGRGPRRRLPAETIRDQALAIAGLLSDEIGGPSVMPPQPQGLWQVVYSSDRWTDATGEDRYRRGLYTFWRRTNPYPSMVAFDAPSREFCVVRRTPTNTPLQALVVLNDPVYVEAARALARRALRECPDGTDLDRIDHAVRLCLVREPTDDERNRLLQLLERERRHYAGAPAAAHALAGATPIDTSPADLAAWTIAASVLLNLDETLHKP